MKKKKDNVEKSEQQQNKTFHVVLITSLIALLLVSFLGFGYGLGALKIVDIMGQHLINFEKENAGAKVNDDGTIDIKSRTVQFLYNEVASDVKDQCNYGWQFKLNDEDQVAMAVVGMNLNVKKGNMVNTSEIPGLTDYNAGIQEGDGVSYAFSKSEVERVYKQVYGKDAVLDTNKNIVVGPGSIVVYHYNQASDTYYPYHINAGSECGPVGETTELTKAELDGSNLKLYQKAEYVDKTDASKNSKYNYVYSFEKESDGMYKFIKRTKEDIK